MDEPLRIRDDITLVKAATGPRRPGLHDQLAHLWATLLSPVAPRRSVVTLFHDFRRTSASA
jgi:hypothetical protein